MRDLAYLHTGYCITHLKIYTDVLVKDAETGRINQIVAASQWDVLQAEIRYLTNWRNNLLGFHVLEDR
ncbi:hypothetical protein A7U60_g3574 [Sanghuangporus baumii]|uniref:Uncharacterized protein n=1 Tax=Sanghuangporus baumii TaxID=108892 RepID=A0A9Q5I071_SANBA|nr:hypothetical protein A7U60_g3574 [Sanghuangporus baumii]